ncbi:MAG: cytochrome c oxidase assembly protein [Alphaproteobacteria bacterium]|nr:cytochrome c oxidase assembly protein [Alphaproteobacteria bacterium]
MTAIGRNGRMALILSGVVAGMVGLSFASVPLYRLFCQVTGYGGTTQRAERDAREVLERLVTVRFNAETARDMPWTFRPAQRQVEVKVGETNLALYRAENKSSQTITGTATFNVTPAKAGLYFSKIQCFCFDEQTLKPGEGVDMPVSFYVDPAIKNDRNLDDVKTITLSYTFFRAREPQAPRLSGLPDGAKVN